MSRKSLLAFVLLVITGELANAQCPPQTRMPCQSNKPVSTNCNVQCFPTIIYPNCSTSHYRVVVSNSTIVGERVVSPVYYPTPNLVMAPSVTCGSCTTLGYTIAGTTLAPTPTAEPIKPASSKCACSLREIASDNTNGRAMNSIVERPNSVPRSPFSEAGNVRPDSGRAQPNLCEIEFWECCAANGENCVAKYADCAELTGEKVKHATCPDDIPEPAARTKTDNVQKAETSEPVTRVSSVRGT